MADTRPDLSGYGKENEQASDGTVMVACGPYSFGPGGGSPAILSLCFTSKVVDYLSDCSVCKGSGPQSLYRYINMTDTKPGRPTHHPDLRFSSTS